MNKKIIVFMCLIIVCYFAFLEIKPKYEELNKALTQKIEAEQKLNTSVNITTAYTVEDENTNIDSKIQENDLQSNRSLENVKIEVLKDSISRKRATIIVTDNNEVSYGWGEDYRIEQKIDGNWQEIEPNKDVVFKSIAYNRDANNQITFKINWENNYGELENGIYRIVKLVYDNNDYIKLYSNEFEIK